MRSTSRILVSLVLALAVGACGSDDSRPGDARDGVGDDGSADGSGSAGDSGDGANDDTPAPPQFPGGGANAGAEALQPGIGPETAGSCGTGGAAVPGQDAPVQVQSVCFFGDQDPTMPAALIEQVIESVDNVEYVHVRLTFSPYFVDNTYGENAVGWENSKKGTHTFKDLVGSDHAEIILTDGDGEPAMQFVVDYISEDPDSPSGYSTLGVMGGKNDGEMIMGETDHILAVTTSMDRNFNGCGYDTYTENSPLTDPTFAPDPQAPNWDYRMVYEVWVAMDAFGAAGFGEALIESVHASPSKGEDNTIEVTPGPCPPEDCFNLDGACQDNDCPEPGPEPVPEPEPEPPAPPIHPI